MNKNRPKKHASKQHNQWRTHSLSQFAWALFTVGTMPSVGSASVPLLPAFVFDEVFVDETAPAPKDPYADLTDELPPAPAIDSKSVSERLDALKASYQEADKWQKIMSQTNGILPDDPIALAALESNISNNTPTFVTFSHLDGTVSSTPVARLGEQGVPIGLQTDILPTANATNITNQSGVHQVNTNQLNTNQLNTNQSNANQPNINLPTYQGLNPDEHLPAYQASESPIVVSPSDVAITKKNPSLLKKAYRKIFKDGEGVLSKINSKIYLAIPNEVAQNEVKNIAQDDNQEGDAESVFVDNWQFENDRLASIDVYNQNVTLQTVDLAIEPYKNIANALANVGEESIEDFGSSLPRLRELVSNASRAVGYYDTAFNLRQEKDGTVAVVIYDLGKPVTVTSQVLDIRGAGANLPSFQKIQENATPKTGQSFHHGEYEATKIAIDQNSNEHGFFDGKWLNNSVDVVLPDNTADIGLVYDTGEQYVFDEVVFFTIDPQTGELTADPDKLPVKLSLLQKMVTFKPNQAFTRSQVNKLSNGLLATRYFNASNVEVVMPDPTGASVDFRQGAGSQNGANDDNIIAQDDKTNNANLPNGLPMIDPINANANNTNANNANSGENVNGIHNATAESQSTTVQDETGQVLGEISPIDFSPSQAIVEKVALVKAKAERLLNSPDDRVLDENDKKSTSLLGRVSDAIQAVAQYILPDESKDEKPTLADGETPPTLANKKSAGQVYADKKIPLYVFVTADKPKDAQIGLGYGSDTKWRVTTRFENHLMNKKGFQSGVELSIAQNSKNADAYISRPLTHPVNDKSTASIKFAEQDINQAVSGFDLTTRSVETALTRTRIKESSWHRSYTLRYRLDSLKTTAPQNTWEGLPVRFLASGTHQEASLLGYAMNKSTQNHLTAPTAGTRQSYSLELGSRHLNSDANMAILRAGVGGMASFGNNQWGENRANQLIGRADFGYLWTDDFDKVPYRLRFFAGGDQSVRGYAFESLSPINASGYLTGGQALATASVEYNREMREGLRLAAFADVGSAYDKDFKNDTKIGIGLGVRYASPIGTVRMDIAKGIADKEQETPVRLHFLIGLPF